MKLLFAIIQSEDEKRLMRCLIEQEFNVTRISSYGGFLHSGNATLMVGLEEDRIQNALEIIKTNSRRRKIFTPATPMAFKSSESVPIPMEVCVGGATVFIMDVEQFIKY